ncbi:MAG: PAS domain S-box protein [Azospirillum sp.]|nr:PAS domain S-box protein [Azospirillum sp.]
MKYPLSPFRLLMLAIMLATTVDTAHATVASRSTPLFLLQYMTADHPTGADDRGAIVGGADQPRGGAAAGWLRVADHEPDGRGRFVTDRELRLSSVALGSILVTLALSVGLLVVAHGRGAALRLEIAERRRAEAELRDSEERFRQFMANSPTVAWIKDVEGRYVYCSRTLEERFAKRFDEWPGKTDFELWPPDIAEAFTAHDSLVRTSGRPLDFEEETPGPDGRGSSWHVCKFPFENHSGTSYVGGIAIDVTDRKRAQEELARQRVEAVALESAVRFNAFTEAMPAILFVTDPAGACTHVNARYQEYTGLPADAVTGDGWLQIVHPDDRSRTAIAWREAVRTGAPYEIEYRLRRHDGAWRWFLGRGVPQRDAAGEIVQWVGVCTDINALRDAQQALRESEEHLRLAQEAANIGTWDWNVATGVGVWSPESYRQHGYDPDHDQASYDLWVSSIHPKDRDDTVEALRMTVEARGEFQHEYRVVWPDGQVRWIVTRGRAVANGSGQAQRMIGVNLDLTEHRAIEEALLRSRMEVQHAARLSAIGEVASTIAHEINQPIGAASNYIQTARLTCSDPALRELLDKAIEQMRRTSQTIRAVRDLSANRRTERRPEVLGPVVEEACFLGLLGDRGRGVALVVEIPQDIPMVMIDRVQIELVLVNLVRNAADALAAVDAKQIRITATPVEADGFLELAVADTGPGIVAEVRQRLFQPFFTTKPRGTGIGLSTSRMIIQAHGGELWAETGSNGGAVFRLTLPLQEPSHGRTEAAGLHRR